MKKITILAVLIIFSFSSCVKNKNVLTGKVTYKDATGFAYIANKAVINIMSTEDKAGLSYSYRTETNSNGTYTINQVDDGEWYVYATFVDDTLTYKGKTDLFKTKGDDVVNRDLILLK